MHNLDSAYGRFDWPDPRRWPPEILRLYRSATEPRSLRDIFIVDLGDCGALYFEDAITALTVIAVPRSEWYVDRGYPSVVFSRSKIRDYTRKFQDAGYMVQILENPASARDEETGKVVNIATGRDSMHRKRRKWA